MNGLRSEPPSSRLGTKANRRQVIHAVAGGLIAGALPRTGIRAATVADDVRYWDYAGSVPILAESYEDVLFTNGDVFFGPSSVAGTGIPPEVDALFAGDSPALQVRFDRIVKSDNSRAAYVYQIQFADAGGATAGYESLLATIVRSDAEDITKSIKGLDASDAYRLGFTGSDGQEISRISAVGRYDDTVIFLFDDRYGGRKNDVGPGRTTFAALAEGYELARSGEQLPAHAPLVPGIPLLEGVNRLNYYPAFVGGVAIPRQGADPENNARWNPGVQDAIFGNFALTAGSDQYAVFFAIRRFADEEAQRHYFENVGDIYEESGQALGIRWVKDEAAAETASAVRAFPALQNEDLGDFLVFAGLIVGVLLIGVDIVSLVGPDCVADFGLFVLFGGDPDDLGDDPEDWPDHEVRRDVASGLTREAIDRLKGDAPPGTEPPSDLYLPDGRTLERFVEDLEKREEERDDD